MRLIDADELKEWIIGFRSAGLGSLKIKKIVSYIDGQDTAFDLESVIEKLEENKADAIKTIEENSKSEFEMIKIRDLKELFEVYTKEQIEILKSAANATNGKIGG